MLATVQTMYDAIIAATCKYFSINRDELMKKSHRTEPVYHRRVCMYLIRNETGLSLDAIGSRFGMTGENVRICVDIIDSTKDVYKWIANDLKNIRQLFEV